MKYVFYAVIEFGLGDYKQIPYEWDISNEEKDIIDKCIADKIDFADAEDLSDLYHIIFEEAYRIESELYYNENENFESPDDEVIPFDNFAFYLTF